MHHRNPYGSACSDQADQRLPGTRHFDDVVDETTG
jgi:hypothetical protein